MASMTSNQKLQRDVVSACSAVVDLDAEGDPTIDAAIMQLYDILKARWPR